MARTMRMTTGLCVALTLGGMSLAAGDRPVDKWVTAVGRAAGTTDKARDDAIAQALRTAVEEACGVFLTAQTKTEDYKAVYDKVLANAVGYVKKHKVDRVEAVDGVTVATVRALVSTKKFEEDWASIAHTVNQENNPRVIVALSEVVHHGTRGRTYEQTDNSTIGGKVEDFFLKKGITLMDKDTAGKITKRDVLLAALKDDTDEVASLGARFKADVVVTGQATVKFGKELEVGGVTMYQYTGTLNVRVIQTDSARVLASKSFGPVTVNTLQRGGGEDKVIARLSETVAPKLLSAVVKAWRDRANVRRTIDIRVSGMDYPAWKIFKAEAGKFRGVEALRLREITEGVASIDVEYRYDNESLADRLGELKGLKLKILEITANRLKCKVVEDKQADDDE